MICNYSLPIFDNWNTNVVSNKFNVPIHSPPLHSQKCYAHSQKRHRYIHTNVISNKFNAPIHSHKCYAPIHSCVLSQNFKQKPHNEQACKIKFKATNSVEIMDLHQPYQDCPLQCPLFALLSAYISR